MNFCNRDKSSYGSDNLSIKYDVKCGHGKSIKCMNSRNFSSFNAFFCMTIDTYDCVVGMNNDLH